VLCGSADFHIGTGAVVSPGQRVRALAVEIVVVISAAAAVVVITTPPTALVLLSWPHRSFT